LRQQFCGGASKLAEDCDWTGLQAHYDSIGRTSRCKRTGEARCCQQAHRCQQAGLSILNLANGRVPYNMCRNLEWVACAAMGKLPGQGTSLMRFSPPPNQLQPSKEGRRPLGQCGGWRPPGNATYGYANDDIYFLEVCLISFLCANGDDIFKLRSSDGEFLCNFSHQRLAELEEMLLAPSKPRAKEAMSCTVRLPGLEGNVRKGPEAAKLLGASQATPTVRERRHHKLPVCGDNCKAGCLCNR
jgi:hypothetical protein